MSDNFLSQQPRKRPPELTPAQKAHERAQLAKPRYNVGNLGEAMDHIGCVVGNLDLGLAKRASDVSAGRENRDVLRRLTKLTPTDIALRSIIRHWEDRFEVPIVTSSDPGVRSLAGVVPKPPVAHRVFQSLRAALNAQEQHERGTPARSALDDMVLALGAMATVVAHRAKIPERRESSDRTKVALIARFLAFKEEASAEHEPVAPSP